ncbi:MAG: hypothetical protein IIW19_00535, partial [Clostridia bacterium]|nr:hypothetical protein [Clostridia bacterium]
MKRKLMACLLFVCMVIGVFAVLPVQASEAKEAKSDTDYSALYVQDGLTLFFEAYTGETLDLDAGKWYASNDSTKFITLANANGNLRWTYNAAKGGVGYQMTFNQWSSLAQVSGGKNPNVGLVLDFSYLPEDEYTVETVLLWQGLTNEDGTIYKMADPSIEKWGIHTRNFSPVALGPLQALGFVSDADSAACPQAMTNSLRWFYSNATWAATKENTAKVAIDRHQVANNAVSAISVTMANDQYGFYSGGTLLTTFDPLTKSAALTAQGILPHAGEFHFLYGYAGTAYTVRVYDRALTEAEMQQNHFADLAASVNLDISAYLAASEDSRAFVNRIFAGFAVGTSKEALEESLEQLLGASGGGSLEDSLYVTDGMTLFLSAMSDYASSVSVNDGIGYWRAQTGQFITLTGNTWFQKPDGGVGYSLNRSEYGSGKAVGLILGSDMLPSEDYSVEIVMSVQGVTDNEGNRFVDTTSNYGLYHNYGMAFGPMKSITFVSLRQEGKADGILEGRYYYIAQGDWKAAKNICKYYDYALRTPDMDDVITWNVYHDCYPSGRSFASKYEFVSDNLDNPKNVVIGSGDYVPYEKSEQYFNIMNRFPATFYAVRVYDRVLTAAERNQNHVADLINFYELDTTFLDITVNVLGEADKVYATLTDIDFSLSKEEAQEAFDGALGKAWISSVGVAIRTDNNVGLRAAFRLPKSTVEECQTVVKVITREGGRQESFFLSEDEFAMSVQYRNCGTAEYLNQVTFIGYMAIYDAEGNLFYYLPSVMDPSSFDLSPFNAYRYHAYGDYSTNSFIK